MGINHLGRLTGTGRLTAGATTIEDVRYEIDVLQDGYVRRGQGSLYGDFFALMGAATPQAALELSDGSSVTVFLSQTDPVRGVAHIATSGPIPGF